MNEQHRVKAVWLASVLSLQVAGCASDDGVASHLGTGSRRRQWLERFSRRQCLSDSWKLGQLAMERAVHR